MESAGSQLFPCDAASVSFSPSHRGLGGISHVCNWAAVVSTALQRLSDAGHTSGLDVTAVTLDGVDSPPTGLLGTHQLWLWPGAEGGPVSRVHGERTGKQAGMRPAVLFIHMAQNSAILLI